VTVSTELVLGNAVLREVFDVQHLDTSDHRSGANLGRWDAANIALAVRSLARLAALLRGPPGTVYLPISQSAAAFLRDSLLIRLAVLRGWRVAIHLRGSEFAALYAGSRRASRAWMRSTLSRVTSAAVMGESLLGAFGPLVPADRVVVVPNGTPPSTINGVAREPLQVLFLSNLRRRKGVIEAVEAALRTLRAVPGSRFVFAGSWEDDVLRQHVERLCIGNADRIDFRDELTGDAKSRLLASSSVLLFPPREPEGHPRVVLEALAAGLPVVTTNRGAIAETVEDGVSGYVLPDPDPESLANHVSLLLTNDDLCRRMSEAARTRYEDRFTQEIADERLATWLRSVSGEAQ